jgi:class 3 adenylate cyclase/DNA-binding winged helix-turn-helix (wHTH) protein
VIEARLGRELAERISGAEYRELEGRAHVPWSGDGEQAVDAITDFLTGQKPAGAVRRRLATVCFVDIVDSTVVLRTIGDARWSARLDRFHALVAEEAAIRGGVVVKDTGDGALLTFDLPGAALELCRALRRRVRGLDLTLRSGVHTGEIELRDDDIAGLSVVVASRVCSAAAPDQILATRTVAELAAGGGHRFVDVGLHDLKGIAGRVELVDVDPTAERTGDHDAVPNLDSDVDGGGGDVDRPTRYRFGACELDVVAFELRRDGHAVDVEPQVLEVLVHLVEHAGELVPKQQLLDDVWGHRFASESTLSSRIRSARQAIGDDGRRQAMIKTVHGRGFRFVAEVRPA